MLHHRSKSFVNATCSVHSNIFHSQLLGRGIIPALWELQALFAVIISDDHHLLILFLTVSDSFLTLMHWWVVKWILDPLQIFGVLSLCGALLFPLSWSENYTFLGFSVLSAPSHIRDTVKPCLAFCPQVAACKLTPRSELDSHKSPLIIFIA